MYVTYFFNMKTFMRVLVIGLIFVTMATADTCLGNKEQSILKSIRSSLKLLEDKLNDKKAKRCPVGWKKYNNHCYFFSTDSKTWFESERICRGLGGYLTQITDSEENNWITHVIKSFGGSSSPWMGATDNGFKVGDYRWVNDLSKVKFSKWHPGQPDVNTEHCGQFYHPFSYNWNNFSCSMKGPYICERPVRGSCQPYAYARMIKK